MEKEYAFARFKDLLTDFSKRVASVFSKSGCLRLCIVWLLIYYVMIEMKNLYEIPWLVDDYPTWVMGIE